MEEALRNLGIPDDASPREKFRAVMQWRLGDPEWAVQVISWMVEAGYAVYVSDELGYTIPVPDELEG